MLIVGKNIPHDSSKGHVSGESIFIDDIPFAKNELIVDFVGSPFAHGKLKKVDYSKALEVDGIVGIFTYKDLKENLFGPVIQDEHLLVEDISHYLLEPILIIAGEDRKSIDKAKKLISIDMEELEPVLSIDEAIEKNNFIGLERFIKSGNFEESFKNSEFKLENIFENAGQEHFYLESQASIAYPSEDDSIVIQCSTQNPSEIQQVVSKLLGLNQNKVTCINKRMGGGFGGKESQACHFAVMVSLVAHKLKRPARIVLDKDTDMIVTGKRHAFKNWYKVGFDKNGKINALKVNLFSNGGSSADLSTSILERAMLHIENAYYIPNTEIIGRICKTNIPSNTAFRGFGGPQGVANMENIIEEIANFLKKDSYDIRRINCYDKDKNNIAPYGQIIYNNVLPDIFDELLVTSNYKERLKEINEFNKNSKLYLKGIAFTPVKFGIAFTTKFLNQGNALVNIYLDGTIQVSTGGTEMGQGLNTKIRQLVAEEFSIDYRNVRMMETSTDKNNNTSPTAASSGTDINGNAAVIACRKIKEGLIEFASTIFEDYEDGIVKSPNNIVFENNFVYDNRRPNRKIPFKEFINMAHKGRVSLGEKGFYQTPGVDFNRDTGKGNPFMYYTNGAAVSEITIDKFTGHISLDRADILIDIGVSINPGIDKGQITGGFIQCMGWVTTEDLRYNNKGLLLSHSPTTYKIPNIQDIPDIFNIRFFENNTNIINIRSSKAVGEPPFLLGISVWCAIKNAINSISDNKIDLKMPATNEEIIRCLDKADLYNNIEKNKEPIFIKT